MDSDIHQPHERNSSATSTPPLTKELSAFESENQEQEYEKNSVLTIKLPSSVQELNNGGEGFEEEEEPRTPTSSDQKIPATTTCPPAPRKPKTVPMGNKRKSRSFQRISVDLMVIMNAMFDPVTVPDFLAGDLDAGDHSKKVKKANVTTG
ncbi:hypothetical protein L2E82_20676 [Cichorium intybus]|uniref:Uncharacterized protein n=1 Tax=Cichorium intybus TaxID=13427 RepID=A0ACB9DU06_CICIN|nr:hypothetical protein L2E82_20676 [Cichorium intybus]